MKYLFIVQGEGRGHMTQAITLANILRRHNHSVVAVLLGMNKNLDIPSFFLERMEADVLTFETPSFAFSKNKKSISLSKTLLKNIRPDKLKMYVQNTEFIHNKIKEYNPDVVINFFDLLSGLTNMRYREEIPFINIAHQFLIKHPDYDFGRDTGKGMTAFRLYEYISEIGSTKTLALSFYPLKDLCRERMAVLPPLLRDEVYKLKPTKGNYILGYMVNPGFMDEIQRWHKHNPSVHLHIFWNKKDAPKEMIVDETLTLHQLDDKKFLDYMAGCMAYITTAGFESVCEAAYLGKPVMMIPAHIEQMVNAQDAASAGLGIYNKTFDITELINYTQQHNGTNTEFRQWVDSAEEAFIKQITTWI